LTHDRASERILDRRAEPGSPSSPPHVTLRSADAPYDAVINALRILITKSGHQLGPIVVLTEKNLSVMKELMEQLDKDGPSPLAKRIRNEVVGAGEKFHTVTIKFPGIGPCSIPLDDLDE
jgi:hypothetical protein